MRPRSGKKPIVYETRILAYLDILGWKDQVERSSKAPSAMVAVDAAMKRLKAAASDIREYKRVMTRRSRGEWTAPDVTVFSDTVALSCVPTEWSVQVLAIQVQRFCLSLMALGLYTRGAIVRGLLHHKDNIIYGPALNEAHRLESTVAKYPRILVTDGVLPGPLVSMFGDGGQLPAHIIEEDTDTLRFFNPFASMVRPGLLGRDVTERARTNIARDLETHYVDVGIRAKLGWLLTFVDRVLTRVPPDDPAAPDAT